MRGFFAVLIFITTIQTPSFAQDLSASARLAAPGPEHERLNSLVGMWSVEMLVFVDPSQPPLSATGLTAKRELTLDGRYLREELRGELFGRAAARDAILGFNRLDQRFELFTVDTFEPGQMIYYSRGHEGQDQLSLYGESVEAGSGAEPTGRLRKLRFEWQVVSEKSDIQRIFVTYPGDKEHLFVEQRFTRIE